MAQGVSDVQVIVGQPAHRLDALDKVTGAAQYAADLRLPGLLYGKALRSPHAHARIRSIKTDKAGPPVGPYSQGIKAGGFVFVAGEKGMEPTLIRVEPSTRVKREFL